MAAYQGEQAALAAARLVPARDLIGQLRTVLKEPLQASTKVGHTLEQVRLDGLHREQRDKPHQGSDAQSSSLSAWQVQDVVEELVCIIPQRKVFATDIVHGGGDVQEMLEELVGDLLICAVVAPELQRHDQHVQAIHTHPGSCIRLFEVAATWELHTPVEDADIV